MLWLSVIAKMQNINYAFYAFLLSRPVWGAWIEIVKVAGVTFKNGRRAPYGARGLKYYQVVFYQKGNSRAPYGARGLKFYQIGDQYDQPHVAPRMGRVD